MVASNGCGKSEDSKGDCQVKAVVFQDKFVLNSGSLASTKGVEGESVRT
jgi:hypothetical protein